MEDSISKEFVRYRAGFLVGRKAIVKAYKLGENINLETSKPELKKYGYWYVFGYEDGFNYYSEIINNHNIYIENINIGQVIQKSFSNRILEINKRTERSRFIKK